MLLLHLQQQLVSFGMVMQRLRGTTKSSASGTLIIAVTNGSGQWTNTLCFRTHGFTFVGPAESFPLVLSVGIVVQGIVFAIAQSTGLDHLLTLGCTITSQMMLPGS